MADKRAKITPEIRLEASRLKALWDASTTRRTQAVFGEFYELGNQANVGHYLNARNPLNPKAALAFAKELNCTVESFSPRVAKELLALGSPRMSETAANEPTVYERLTDDEHLVLDDYRALIDEDRLEIRAMIAERARRARAYQAQYAERLGLPLVAKTAAARRQEVAEALVEIDGRLKQISLLDE